MTPNIPIDIKEHAKGFVIIPSIEQLCARRLKKPRSVIPILYLSRPVRGCAPLQQDRPRHDFRLAEAAEKSWHRLDDHKSVAENNPRAKVH